MKTFLLALCADRLELLVWLRTKDAEKGRRRPRGILPLLLGDTGEREPAQAFESGEAFEAARRDLLQTLG